MARKLQSAEPDPITAVSKALEGSGPRTMRAKATFAHQQVSSAAAVAADQAVDQASLESARRLAGGPTGKLGDNPLAHRLAGAASTAGRR